MYLAADDRLLDEFARNALEEIEFPVCEREPHRLPFLDDRDLDAPSERQLRLARECAAIGRDSGGIGPDGV